MCRCGFKSGILAGKWRKEALLRRMFARERSRFAILKMALAVLKNEFPRSIKRICEKEKNGNLREFGISISVQIRASRVCFARLR
jgi:hypothetical protein